MLSELRVVCAKKAITLQPNMRCPRGMLSELRVVCAKKAMTLQPNRRCPALLSKKTYALWMLLLRNSARAVHGARQLCNVLCRVSAAVTGVLV